MGTLILLNYNNYYNRRLRYHDRIEDYYNDSHTIQIAQIDSYNFKPNDGITTTLTGIPFDPFDFGTPNYAIYLDDFGSIQSRWFIIDVRRVRENRYDCELKRDILADAYTVILDSPAMIRRALPRVNDPTLYKKEFGNLNQIKTSQTSLKDESGVPWIIGYIDRALASKTITSASETYPVIATYDELADWQYSQYNKDNPIPLAFIDRVYVMRFHKDSPIAANYQFGVDHNGNISTPQLYASRKIAEGLTNYTGIQLPNLVGSSIRSGLGNIENYLEELRQGSLSLIDTFNNLSYDYANVPRSSINDSINLLDGAYIQINQAIYRISIETSTSVWKSAQVDAVFSSSIKNWADNCGDIFETTNGSGAFYYRIQGAYPVLTRVSSGTPSVTIPQTRARSTDSPYDIFAIPYGEISVYSNDDSWDIITDKEVAIRLASDILTQLGAQCYDVQILPYSPLADEYYNRGYNLDSFTEGKNYTIISQDENRLGVIFWLNSSQITKKINHTITIPTTAIDLKVANECDIYRLCSPNYSAIYEFNPFMNNGITKFNITIALKPVNPYIKVCPQFKGLNGNNFKDARGLILSGDFSITKIQDQFINYELNNKNYNSLFNRNIQSMELQNKWAGIGDITQATVGALGAGAQGAMMASMGGAGTGGMIAGGIIAGIASGAAGTVDVIAKRQLRDEQLELYKDTFKLNIGNIKAMPDTLTKVTALNPDNLIFPQIEYYTATPIEKEAIRQSIIYRGCDVGYISTINNFIRQDETFISAQIIRFPDTFVEDYHFLAEINNELSIGVYI